MAKQTYTTGQVLTAAQMTALQANDYNWTVSAKTASYVLVAADAGTRITMSNVGATTITVNTALFTAGDTLTITNIGAGTCTITAGTATVSTAGSLVLNQYDSGTLYFSSTSAAIWNGANPGDITGITTGATSGLAGGVTSGTASLTLATAAKGDLLVGTGANAVQVLTVGSNNQTLVADSTASTGLKWATPASTSTAKGVSVWNSSTITGIANATWTAVTFNSEEFDTDAFHSTSSNTSRLTIPAGLAGTYSVKAQVSFGLSATGMRQLRIYKNGTLYKASGEFIPSSTIYVAPTMSTDMTLTVGDYIELYVYQSSGISQSIYPSIADSQFSMMYWGA